MSGNEITGIHNFFEESSSHQSQVAGSGCVVSNSNSWIGIQGVNRVNKPSDHTDSDQRNVRLPIQTPLGIGLPQFSLKQHFDTIQSKNQQLNLNELMHASTTLQGRSSQAKFQGDGTFLNNQNLMQRGLANYGSQEGNSPGYGSGFPGSLEKPEVTVSPVNYDFLRGHQQLNSPHPGISQPQQRQQQGSNDMQWKQHLIAMQMQEIQRQQQLQQLHLGARQHNSFNPIYGATGQGGADEFPAMLSGMPVTNVVNYMPVEFMGFQSKSPSSSHMLNSGNMIWAQRSMPVMPGMPNGLLYSQDQGQSMYSMGYLPRQLDDSLHGTPVSGNMGSLNHFFQLQGISHDSTSVDLMSKLGESHTERTSMQSSAFNDFHNDQHAIQNEGYSGASFLAGRQGAQGKTSFGNTLVQDTNSDTVLGSIQQSNHLTEGAQVQEFQDGQRRNDWLGKPHECIAAEVTPSPHGTTSLDPTEEKLLFGVDDGIGTSLGGSSNRVAGTYLNGYPMQNNDSLSIFPSLQSGTWSALVQEALEASSSDTGQHEEWSGLSLQKIEPQAENHLVLLSENGKQNTVRDTESNLHISSSLRSKSFPLPSDTAASQSCHSVPHSQQPIKYSYEQNERLEPDHSIQAVQQLSENNDAQFTQNYQPYNFIGNSFEERKQQNSPNGVWAVQEHQQAMHATESAEMGLNSHRMQHSSIHQQKMPFYNMNSQLSNKLTGWGAESPSSSGSRNFKTDENSDMNQYARSNEVNTTMHMEMTHTQSLGKIGENRDAVSFCSLGGPEPVKPEPNSRKMPGEHSYVANLADFMNPNYFRSNMLVNQQQLNRQPGHPLKHVTGHLFVKDKDTNQISDPKRLSTCLQDWDQSPSYTNNESGEAHGHAFSQLNTSHDTADGQNVRSEAFLARNDHFHLSSIGGQTFSGQSDQKSLGSRRFQFHPMGNLEINMKPDNEESNKSHSQGPANPMNWGLKNQEKENFGNFHLAGHVSSSNSIDVRKDCIIDSKKSSPLAEIPRTCTFSGHNPAIPSFTATRAHYSHEKWIGAPSQNVPMIFDKANQSDDSSTAKLNISKNTSSSGIPEGVSLDGPISHLQHNQVNPLQGSGLKLTQPSPRQSTVGNSLSMHTSAAGTHRTWASSTTSAVVLPTIHETSQRESLDYKTVMSPQTGNDSLYSNTTGNSLGVIANIKNQSLGQQQQHNVSCASRQVQFDHSAKHSFGSKVGVDGHPKHVHYPPTQVSHDGSPTSQTSQALFPSMPGKIPDSRIDSFTDGGAPLQSQFYLREGDNSEMINSSSDRRNTNQLHQGVETVFANEPSATPVTPQQGHYSNIFNNVWRNAVSHRPSGLQPQKFATNLLQSMNHLHPSHHDDQRSKNGGNSSEVSTCSTNSQQCTYGEENPLKGSNSEQKHAMGMDVSLRVASPVVQGQESKNVSLHLQDHKKGNHADNQREKVNTTISPSKNDIQKHNYALLQQMQAMKGTDSDPSYVSSKRLKLTDSGCGELDSGSQPGDVKLLSFSSREIEERSCNGSSHLIHGELASCRTTSSPGQHELQNSSLSSSVRNLTGANDSSVLNLTGANERRLINSQMAPSWFEQYETYKDSQTSALSGSLGSFQSAKAAAQNYFFSKNFEQLDNDVMLKRSGDNISENSSPTTVAADSHLSHQKLMVAVESLAPGRKKRKVARLDLLSWHKEITQNSGSLPSFSLVKMKWAQATNRLIEKIEDDTETIDGVSKIIRSRRRLILTTQLIQQIFSPVPAKLLFEDSMMSYEKVIYYLTKLTLGEACSLISVLGCDSGLQLESKNMILEKLNTTKKMREEIFTNIVENFITRLRKLQNNFSRLDSSSSIVDYRMECQDVERVSIINRFAKFHGRGPTDGVEGSSALETAPRRFFPQRHVNVSPMPRNIPDGVTCLSL